MDTKEIDSIDYYTDTKELLLEDDIPETDVVITGWKKKFRIRGLTFGQMEKINKNALDVETGRLQNDEFSYHTIVEGVIRPKFNLTQAKELASKNGAFVRELTDQIWTFSKFSKHIFEKYLDVQEELTKLDESEKPKKPTTKKRM